MVATAGSGWRLAPCLIALIRECDRLFPSRSIASDGSIGDQAHASRSSDHNPSNGWVCAVDVTDDKAHGCDADLLARHLVASRDPRVKYVIWNRTIVKSSQSSNGTPAWQPQPYTGTNAHERHTHISVHNTADVRNDVRPWWPQQPAPLPPPAQPSEDDMPNLLVKGDKSPEWWFTNGLVKRYCRTTQEAQEHAYAGLCRTNNGEPFVVRQGMVDAIPRCDK